MSVWGCENYVSDLFSHVKKWALRHTMNTLVDVAISGDIKFIPGKSWFQRPKNGGFNREMVEIHSKKSSDGFVSSRKRWE